MGETERVVLSLFDHSGSWSRPYALAGYKVIQLDLKLGHDVTLITTAWLSRQLHIDPTARIGVLAAPPCTDFSSSGAQYWPAKDKDGRTEASVNLVLSTLRIIRLLNPAWWCLENPVGRLNKLVPVLAQYGPWYFNPCEYGGWLKPGEKSLDWDKWPANDAYTKRTGLWGKFNQPIKRPVAPVFVTCSSGKRYSPIHWATSDKVMTKQIRSTTPQGFARAFCASNQL